VDARTRLLNGPAQFWRNEPNSIGNGGTARRNSKNRYALNAEIDKLTEKKSTETWVREFNAAGVPCGPIYSIDQMFEDAQVQHLGIAQDVPNEENRHIRLVGQPVTLSRTPSKMAARPPEFGEQTEEVLTCPTHDGSRILQVHSIHQTRTQPPGQSIYSGQRELHRRIQQQPCQSCRRRAAADRAGKADK
jgi:hypothetical protein